MVHVLLRKGETAGEEACAAPEAASGAAALTASLAPLLRLGGASATASVGCSEAATGLDRACLPLLAAIFVLLNCALFLPNLMWR